MSLFCGEALLNPPRDAMLNDDCYKFSEIKYTRNLMMQAEEECLVHIAQIQALLREIVQAGVTDNSQWSEHVQKTLSLVQTFHGCQRVTTPSTIKAASQLESNAVGLWNFAVSLKTKGSLHPGSNAKLRHIAFLLIDFCSCEEKDENSLRKKTLMGLKTGRAWLDSHGPDMAEKILEMTDKFIESLQQMIIEKKNTDGFSERLEKERLEVDQDMFKSLCYRAETMLALSRHEEAMNTLARAKDFLPRFPKEGAFLSMLCYNFGVDTFQKKMLEESISWLRESFEVGKETIGPKNQARTLRLLANVYLEWGQMDFLQKALNAVSLANTDYPHPAGLYLKLRIVLLSNEDTGSILKAVDDIGKHSELTVDLGLNTAQLLLQHSRCDVAIDFLQHLIRKFETTPDYGRLLITNLEMLLQSQKNSEAKQFVEHCITAHNMGNPLDLMVKKRFHVIFWEQAGTAFEDQEFQDALDWYNYSLSLFSHTEKLDKNLAKLQRNRASCYLSLQQIDKAKEAIREAETCDPTMPHTQFILYKIALQESDLNNASVALKKMCDYASEQGSDGGEPLDVSALICLSAQLAFENNQQDMSVLALECLSSCSQDNWQVLTALRCLIRIKLAASELAPDKSIDSMSITQNIQTAYNKLLQMLDNKAIEEQVCNEASWFMKIAWNVALQCDKHPPQMKELFKLSYQLSGLLPVEDGTLVRQKTCLLMASAACLEFARSTISEDEKRSAWEETLLHLSECRRVCSRLQQTSLSLTDVKMKDTSEMLMLLYEFEARVKLNDPDVERVMERVLKLQHTEAKTFETMAALAMEKPAQNKSLSVRALKVAVRKHLQMLQPDYLKCSKLFHSLIQLALTKQAGGSYPEIEMVWLLTKAWNCGIHFYSNSRYEDAEKWCGMGMRVLKYLTSLRNNYEDHMTNIYSEVLAKIELTKAKAAGSEE
ncbi:hypothetical protein ScPMuIL_011763 [Solemya velum]